MAKVKIDYGRPLKDGIALSFKAPCDCSAVDGIRVYYTENGATTSKEFTFKDAHLNTLTGIGNLFKAGAIVKVSVDTVNGYAYIQNADTNGYLEQNFAKKNGSTIQVAADTAPTVAKVRNTALVATETTPTQNGTICWQYE